MAASCASPDPIPELFHASHLRQIGERHHYSTTGSNARVYGMYSSNPTTRPSRTIQIGKFKVEGNNFKNLESNISFTLEASYDPTTLSMHASVEKVPKEYSNPVGETNEICRNSHSKFIAQLCEDKINCQAGKAFSTNLGDFKKEIGLPEISKYIDKYLTDSWRKNASEIPKIALEKSQENINSTNHTKLFKPSKFKNKYADKITNFNPSTDTLEIDTDSFGIDSTGTFTSGKNKKAVKKKLAKQDFDFLYDQKKGGLYFNENGADIGFGNGGLIAILKGAPDLTTSNLDFI